MNNANTIQYVNHCSSSALSSVCNADIDAIKGYTKPTISIITLKLKNAINNATGNNTNVTAAVVLSTPVCSWILLTISLAVGLLWRNSSILT